MLQLKLSYGTEKISCLMSRHYLITAFEKKDQENLTKEEKNVLKKLVKSLKEEAAKKRR